MGEKGYILVVDDEPMITGFLEEVLRFSGFAVSVFNDAKELIAHYRSVHNKVGLVITDMRMPGMSGYACFKELKKINPEVRVIALSGECSSDELNEMFMEGFCAFRKKPVSMKDLKAAIEQAMPKETV